MYWPQPFPDLPLTVGAIDPSAMERRRAELLPELLADPATKVIEIRGSVARMLHVDDPVGEDDVVEESVDWRSPLAGDGDHLAAFIGRDGGGTAYVMVMSPQELPSDDRAWRTLRQAGVRLGPDDAQAYTTAVALAEWHAGQGFCPRCGSPTGVIEAGWVRECTGCGRAHFPVVSPSIIVSVVDDAGRLLLGRSPRWPARRYSVLAGFVEPGESLEHAVAREVFEETGVRVGEMRYLGSQPWPFPSSLMVGYTARALTTDIVVDPVEMAEARWVSRSEYDQMLASGAGTPTQFSISSYLIAAWRDAHH